MNTKLDPRIKRTRQWLRQALLDLMTEKSFPSITVQDIAGRATVNRVTFYAHFEDKHALLEGILRERFRQRMRSRLPEGSSFSPENMAQLILTVCEFLAEIHRQCPPPHGQLELLMEKQIKAEMYDVLRAWLAAMQWGDETQHRPTVEQMAMIITWACCGAAVHWSGQPRPKPAREFVRQLLPLILAGLQPYG